jgi:hypothetical protein
VSWRSAAVKTICTDSAQINTTFGFVYETYVIYHLIFFVNQYNFCHASPELMPLLTLELFVEIRCFPLMKTFLMILFLVYIKVINNIIGCLLLNCSYWFLDIKFNSTTFLRLAVPTLENWDLQWTVIIPIIAPV